MSYGIEALQDSLGRVEPNAAQRVARAVEERGRVFVYGAGRSGLMLKAFAMRLAQMDRRVFAVGEVVTPAIAEGDLLVLASASGETDSVVRYAQAAARAGASVLAITARDDSTLGTLADTVITIPAPTKDDGNAKSLMGTVFEQSLLLFCDGVIGELGADAESMRARHANLE